MSIYDYDTDLFNQQMTPPTKRLTKFNAWGKAVLTQLQYTIDLIFGNYADGDISADYSNVTVYSIGDRVRYTDKSVYEYINDTPDSGNAPTDVLYWRKILQTYVGVRERAKYNAQKMVYEYALNKWFNTTFRLPSVGVSDIYIVTNTVDINYFVSGVDGASSSGAAISGAKSVEFVGTSYTYSGNYYTIFVPVAVFTALGSTLAEREAQITNFADRINLAGLTYNIDTY